MREEGLVRLSGTRIRRNNADYIVMYFLIRDLRSAIAEYASGDVLDIGCGNKPYRELFNSNIASYTGCDVIQSSGNKVDVICEATNLLFDNVRFDTVFSTQVMEHVSDPATMLQEANRVLKPGGMAIFSIPMCWELHEEPYDFFRFTKYGLDALFTRAGFEITPIKANGGKWAAISQLNLNMVYSSFRKRKWWIKPFKFLFINLHFTSLLNRIAVWLDHRFYDELLTLNYVVVAKKK